MSIPLSIGMATFSDHEGVWATVQALRLYHAEAMRHCELIVVDNDPQSEHGQENRKLISWVYARRDCADVRWIPFTATQGTAAPRQHIFDQARGKAVLVMDCHVLLVPGAIQRLLDWYAANPGTCDLVSGPLLYDDLATYSTHFTDVWEEKMWGKWGMDLRGSEAPQAVWHCPCGNLPFTVGVLRGGAPTTPAPVARYCHLDGQEIKDRICPGCCKELPFMLFDSNDSLLKYGYTKTMEDALPFEIPAMGLGLFSCRREAWLGFNPRFREFGGEEWYIHTKFRMAGYKCLCLPFLRWPHRFNQPSGKCYTRTVRGMIWNYVVGHRELGLDLARCYQHFVGDCGVPQHEWDAIVAEVDGVPAEPAPAFGSTVVCAGL